MNECTKLCKSHFFVFCVKTSYFSFHTTIYFSTRLPFYWLPWRTISSTLHFPLTDQLTQTITTALVDRRKLLRVVIWAPSQYKDTVPPRYGDSHVKDKTVDETVLSLTWESPILVRRHVYSDTPPVGY